MIANEVFGMLRDVLLLQGVPRHWPGRILLLDKSQLFTPPRIRVRRDQAAKKNHHVITWRRP